MAAIEEEEVPAGAVSSLQGMIAHLEHAGAVLQWAADWAGDDDDTGLLLRSKYVLNRIRERLAERLAEVD